MKKLLAGRGLPQHFAAISLYQRGICFRRICFIAHLPAILRSEMIFIFL
jgi:hypothetical protein